MKAIKIFYLMLLPLLAMACSDEDNEDLFPSGLDKNWFVIEDSSDPIDHQIYQFYVETGIPVFYNDTIGSEVLVDKWGNSYTYYEVLRFTTSSLGGTETLNPFQSYELCTKESVPDGLEFLRTDIIPVVPSSIHIQSILLLNSLTPWNVNTTSSEAFKGLNTVLVSRISEIASMTEDERKAFRASVLGALVSTSITTYADEMDLFYSATRNCYSTADLYGCYGWYFYNTYGFSDPRQVGFLKDPNPYDYSAMPSETQDVSMYIQAIFSMTRDEFEAQYGGFSIVMEKYNRLVSVLKEIGFDI